MTHSIKHETMTSRISLMIMVMMTYCASSKLFAQEKDLSKILWSANWSTDNSYFAVGGVDRNIRIFSGHTLELLKIIQNKSAVQRMSWHPYRNILAVAATEDGSRLIDLEKDTVIHLKGLNTNGTRAIDWNYNGELIALADYEGIITLWNQKGELLLNITKENTKGNVAIDWHPFKNEFVVLSDSVRMYDSDGKLLHKFGHRKENVLMLCVQWHKSGDFFVIGDYGDYEYGYKALLQFWKADGTLLKVSDISKAEYRNIAWNKKGNRLVTASDALRIWNKKGKLLATGFSEHNLWGIDWSPNGKYIVTSDFDGHIRIWDKKARLVRQLE